MKLHIKEYGNKKGSTIIFLHGCGVGSWAWYEQTKFFNEYHCILIDMPEHGGSLDVGPFKIKSSAEYVAQIIRERANGGKAYVIGHEMGAKVALELLKKNEDIVEKAVISSVVLKSGPEGKYHEILPHKLMVGIFNLKYIALKFESFRQFAAKSYGITGEENIKKYIQEMKGYTPEQLISLIRESFIVPFDIEELRNVKTPSLILVGENELPHIKESSIEVSDVLQNNTCALIHEGTHAHPRVQKNLFNKLCSEFIKGEEHECEKELISSQVAAS